MIIDSSALSAIMLREERAGRIIRLVTEDKPYTLPLAIKETINAALKRYTRKELTYEEVQKIAEQLLMLTSRNALTIINQDRYVAKAVKIAAENKITIYDAIFIAAAQETEDILLTLDEKQAHITERLGVKTITF